ncbi:FCD domain-containing protein [Pseudosulfitobacter sp. SM2401]|uniref:GntR family transcriptional regulator n=1 Tax=Pseudosulfitobacter sp. SM2401 TaxID=3350098 RepID=UPI0036F26334
MPTTPKDRKSAAYDMLARSILTQARGPGADLDEQRLSREFDLSRTPMREVLRDLAGAGYVELRENKGARVSEMSQGSLRDFFVAAPMVYGAILQLAAHNRTDAQIVELQHAQDAFKAALATGSAADRALANNHFHAVTGEMADNIYLRPSFHRLLIDHARISMTFYRPQDGEMTDKVSAASTQHDAIIAAIIAHDADTAAQLAADHWRLSRDQIQSFVMPSGLDVPLGELPRSIA